MLPRRVSPLFRLMNTSYVTAVRCFDGNMEGGSAERFRGMLPEVMQRPQSSVIPSAESKPHLLPTCRAFYTLCVPYRAAEVHELLAVGSRLDEAIGPIRSGPMCQRPPSLPTTVCAPLRCTIHRFVLGLASFWRSHCVDGGDDRVISRGIQTAIPAGAKERIVFYREQVRRELFKRFFCGPGQLLGAFRALSKNGCPPLQQWRTTLGAVEPCVSLVLH